MNALEPMPTEAIDALNTRCYNAKADYWDRMPFADFLPAQILFQHSPSVGMNALDIGSGTGMLAEWLTKQGFNLLCLDPSKEMVKRCQKKNLQTLQTTIQNFSTDEKFGLIIAVLSFIHLSKREIPTQLDRVASWLNPGGTFVLALIEGIGEGISEKSSDYPRYFSYYNPDEVLELTKKDFNCVFESRISGPISYLVFIFQKKV